MNLWNSPTYRRELQEVLSTMDLSPLRGKSILITGATGLICSAVVDLLLLFNETAQGGMTIYAASRSVARIEARFPDKTSSGLVAVEYDATEGKSFPFAVECIVHGAGNASPDKYISEPVDTLMANILGVQTLLRYGKECGLSKFVYLSSSEVYGKLTQAEPLVENVYGTVDVLAPRSSYPLGKQAAEALCIAFGNQYGMNVSIARPGHVYGPTATVTDNRVSSAFARQAALGEDLVMKSAGTQLRSYCHCLDCASAILTILLKGERQQAYNISNRDSIITIRQMAEIIARTAGVRLIMDVPTALEQAAFNPMDNSSLNSDKLYGLGWKGLLDAEKGFANTIAVLKELQQS